MNDRLSLAAEFPSTDAAEWRKLVDAALKGASFEKRLVSQTYDGLRVEPLYPRAAGVEPVAGRKAGTAWTVMQRVDHPEPKAANKQALEDLENGASGLSLILAGAPAAHGFGVAANTGDNVDRLFADVMLDLISLRIETAPFDGRTVATLMTEFVARQKLDPSRLAIDFGLDPIGDFARTGGSPLPWSDLSARAGETARFLQAKGFSEARFLRADGRTVHDAGGSEAQELAYIVANGIAYLSLLEVNGFALDEARRRVSFMLSADADQFLTIAKFRALRKLWARVEQACGLTPRPAMVAAETAWRMLTQRDPNVNMLRATIAVAAAGLGGADDIAALPHTLALGLSDAFARRVARNTQLVLLEESHLAKVSDPAAGSGAIEALTNELCAAAWSQLQDIEKAGGAWAALETGLIQKNVASVRAAHQAAIARRKDTLIGTSDYPNLGEKLPAVLDIVPAPTLKTAATVEPLPRIRLAEPFEALRDKSDAVLAKTGARPKVFLATLGTLADFTPRAMFAKNFYEAGGIEALAGEGFKKPTDMIAAFKTSGVKLACLCGSDTAYAEQATNAAKALTEAGAIVHMAGRPGELEAAFKEVGVKSFVFVGCDVLSTLQATHDSLGLP